jgi:putative transposase
MQSGIVLLSYRFRLYPNKEQERRFLSALEINRIVYNYFVLRNFKNRNDMNYALTELKEQQPILHDYHSKMLQSVSTKVAGAWKALAELKKRGNQTGKGRLLLLKQCSSFTYSQTGYRIDGNRLYLSKIGSIKIKLYRQPVNIKQVTIKRKNGKWYAIVTCNILRWAYSVLAVSKRVGIDVGINHFAYDSDGSNTENPLFLKKMLKPLKRAQRTMSRRRKGSKNREKAKSRVAILHERIANKRRDFLHRLSTQYASRYDIIFLERLRTLNMVKNHRMARSILDSGWRTFGRMLRYKANRVVEVEPYSTSILCSRCSSKVPKSLAIRTHRCGKCGLTVDRDHNASLNILQRGLALLNLPVERREFTPVETVPLPAIVGGHVQSLKQETHVTLRG